MKFAIGVVCAVWLVSGAVAAQQRNYFGYGVTSCDSGATVAATIAAGPLNYQGLNPRSPARSRRPDPRDRSGYGVASESM